jgi:hypothetical protein
MRIVLDLLRAGLVAAFLANSLAIAATEQSLEIRGFRLGMSEQAVRDHAYALYKESRGQRIKKGPPDCKRGDDKHEADRQCSYVVFVLERIGVARLNFYDDVLGKFDINMSPRRRLGETVATLFDAYVEAFTEKYGKPSAVENGYSSWSVNGDVLAVTITQWDQLHRNRPVSTLLRTC